MIDFRREPATPKKSTSVRIEQTTHDIIANLATKQGCSFNFKLNEILREWEKGYFKAIGRHPLEDREQR